jgi:hypothetical protein
MAGNRSSICLFELAILYCLSMLLRHSLYVLLGIFNFKGCVLHVQQCRTSCTTQFISYVQWVSALGIGLPVVGSLYVFTGLAASGYRPIWEQTKSGMPLGTFLLIMHLRVNNVVCCSH